MTTLYSCNHVSFEQDGPTCSQISSLYLNGLRHIGSQLKSVQHTFPGVQELHLCNCGFSDLSGFLECSAWKDSLRLLDLQDNQIASWKSVEDLSCLHKYCLYQKELLLVVKYFSVSLEELFLNRNFLTYIDCSSTALSKMRTLNLESNRLSSVSFLSYRMCCDSHGLTVG